MDISSLTDFDLIQLVATFNDQIANTNAKVSAEANSRGYTQEQLAAASGKIQEQFNPIESCGLRFTKPFEHLKYDQLGYVLNLHEAYERGAGPFPGSTSEQPAQIIEVFSVLKQLKLEHQIKSQNSGGRK